MLLATAVTLARAAGCSGGGGAANASRPEKPVLTAHGVSPASVHFASIPFTDMPAELESGAVSAAVLPEPFASDEEETHGGLPVADLDQGATTSFPVEGYAVTKQWAAKHPRTLAAFYTALEQGQRIADISRTAVESAMVQMPAPFGVSAQTAAVMALDSYPFSSVPGRPTAWTRPACSAWSTSCSSSSGSPGSTSAPC